MANFIHLKTTYDVITTETAREKIINVNHIVHITRWDNRANRNIETIKSRIKLLDGEILDVKETVEEILDLINEIKI
jgi:hypothetical protein